MLQDNLVLATKHVVLELIATEEFVSSQLAVVVEAGPGEDKTAKPLFLYRKDTEKNLFISFPQIGQFIFVFTISLSPCQHVKKLF